MDECIIFIVKSCCDNKEQAQHNYMPPLGIMSIANTLRVHGYRIIVLDFSEANYEMPEISKIIDECKPIYIGFSVYTENVNNILVMCKYLKKQYKDIPLVLGGPHATLDPEYCKRKRFVDFIVQGEGERNLLELAEAIRTKQKLIKFDEIQGLIYVSEDGVYTNGPESIFIDNLDLLPIINRDYLSKCFTASLPTIYSSKGCPGKCIYCAAPAMSGTKYRIRDIDNVFLETLYLHSVCENYDQIFYCDDTFTVFNKRLERFAELCQKSSVKFKWRCESRVDSLFRNYYLLPVLKAAGCCRIQFGIESGNQTVLTNIRKEMQLSQAHDIIEKTVKTGIHVVTSFIFGHYCDTISSMEDTLSLMEHLKSRYADMIEIAYALNTPFPGTYQYEHREELGLNLKINNFAELDMYGAVVEGVNFKTEDLQNFNHRAAKIYN